MNSILKFIVGFGLVGVLVYILPIAVTAAILVYLYLTIKSITWVFIGISVTTVTALLIVALFHIWKTMMMEKNLSIHL